MRRLILIHGGALGDCVLALHFADAVRRMMSAERVVVAARSSLVHWARRVGWIDEAIALDALRSRERPAASPARAGARSSEEPGLDVVVSMAGSPAPELLERLGASTSARVVTIDPREESPKADGGRHIVTQWLDRFSDCHHAQNPTDEALKRPPAFDPSAPAFRVVDADRVPRRSALARTLGADDSRWMVLVHPGSGSPGKCAAMEIMESLVQRLGRRSDVAVAWMIGPDELERGGAALHRRLSRWVPVLAHEDVGVAADLVCGADVHVGMDSGMTHVAAVCARRTMAIFGPTNPAVWRPVGASCDVLGFPAGGGATDWINELEARIIDDPLCPLRFAAPTEG